MNTREIYFKTLMSTELPVGLSGYTYKDKNGVIQLGNSLCLRFSNEDHEENIKKMFEMETTISGFMFWNNSPEGEEFFNENSKEIGALLANMIINQK